MVLTIFADMKLVSVYSVYNLISHGIKKLVTNFTNGMEAAFGNMIAKEQSDALNKNFSIVQNLIFSVATVVYTSSALLILEFVSLYTKGVHDIEYIRPSFAYLLMFTQFFSCVRQPYQLVVQAAGHYKQTRNGAMVEPVLNIVISILAVIRFGLVGVVCGTLAATIFRTVQYSLYVSRNLIKGSLSFFLRLCAISATEAAAAFFLYHLLPLQRAENYLQWGLHGILCVMIVGIIVLTGTLIWNRDALFLTLKKIKGIVK